MSVRKYINGVSLVAGLLIIIFIMFYVGNIMHEDNVCIMDSLRLFLQSKCLGKIAILVALSYLYSTRNDFSEMIVLRSQNKRELWFGQCREIRVIAFIYTVPAIAVALFVGLLRGNDVWMNWADTSSYYQEFILKNQIIQPHTTVFQTLIWTLVYTYLLLLITLVFAAMCYWVFNSNVIALISIVLVAMNDSYFAFFPLFYNRFTIHPIDWISPGVETWLNMVALIVIGALIIGIGTVAAKRKEFLNENHISQ